MTTSKSIDGVQEITLIAPLKRGVVPCTGKTLSYASRLRLFLGALFAQRKLQIELNRKEDGLLESLQILDFVRWAIIDDDTKLMLGVSFDGPWEPYIRLIVEKAGPVLDAIFCHCEDYAGASCYDGYPKFSTWVRSHQLEIPFIHAANAELSVDDVRYLKEYEKAHSSGKFAPFAMPRMPYLPAPQPLSRVYALFGLRSLFVGPGGTLNDQQYFDRVAYAILKPDFQTLNQGLQALAAVNPKPTLRDAATGAWLIALQTKENGFGEAHAPRPAMQRELQLRAEIQGNILSSYADTINATHGAYVLVRFKSKEQGAAFLKRILPSISFELSGHAKVKLNLALTFSGLCTLDLNEKELALFPQEFREGLEQRAALLGDVGLNHPERWSLPEGNWPPEAPSGDPVRLTLVDAVLNLQTRSDERGHELLNALRDFLKVEVEGEEIEILHVQPTRRYERGLGHVGAVDGKSQPLIDGQGAGSERDRVPLGELLLGYENSSREPSSLPEGLRLNSTFIAIRKMSQDPSIYRSLSPDQFELALGRKADGRNLIDGADNNAFDYLGDPNGAKCPFFSHVRRSNPRVNDTPRILRRGMTYGPEYNDDVHDATPRGVMFTAIAASLAEQYEVVQRWVNGGNSTGVFSGHPDLIAGTHPLDSGRQLKCPAAGGKITTIPVPARPAAVLQWGLYGFVPSRSALEQLAEVERAPFVVASEDAAAEATPARRQFGAEPLSEDGDAMKARLEDMFRPGMDVATLKHVLGKNGVGTAADFGVIIGAPQLVARALTTPAKFSVRNYWARMRECEATLYLGMDPDPKPLGSEPDEYVAQVPPGRYESEATPANHFIREIGFDESFAAARAAATQWFREQDARYDGLLALIQANPGLAEALAQPPVLDLVALSARVVRDVACKLYGLPESLLSDDLDFEWPAGRAPSTAGSAVRCPVDLTSVFAHVFPPRPSAAASLEASLRGPQIKARIHQWYVQTRPEEERKRSPLIASLAGADDDLVERTIIGLLSGFAVPTNGSLLGVLSQLVRSDELWRMQRLLAHEVASDEELRGRIQTITRRCYDLMIDAPVPAMITRTPMFEEPPIRPPEVVGLHLGAAASIARDGNVHDAWKFLFGDVPAALLGENQHATHRCPGQQMALGVIVGTLYALLEERKLKKVELNPLLLSRY